MTRRRLRSDDYTVGWLCALDIELAAAAEMLDEEHDNTYDYPDYHDDENLYTFGRLCEHNVVIAHLPLGGMGTNSAAVVATRVKDRFRSLRFGLMVGIGGGNPTKDTDIRLGDVVIGYPNRNHGGVIQYDFGKSTPSGFMGMGHLNAPPTILLNALTKLRANRLRGRSTLLEHVSRFSEIPGLSHFTRESAGADHLFQSNYQHVGGLACEKCSKDEIVERPPRDGEPVVVHYGTIASGNQVVKDGATRDKLSAQLGGVQCFEMEAAGLMNNFPCLVIRGICDYADSHKNKRWQPYAAAIAAACAKEILSLVPANDVTLSRTINEDIYYPSLPERYGTNHDRSRSPSASFAGGDFDYRYYRETNFDDPRYLRSERKYSRLNRRDAYLDQSDQVYNETQRLRPYGLERVQSPQPIHSAESNLTMSLPLRPRYTSASSDPTSKKVVVHQQQKRSSSSMTLPITHVEPKEGPQKVSLFPLLKSKGTSSSSSFDQDSSIIESYQMNTIRNESSPRSSPSAETELGRTSSSPASYPPFTPKKGLTASPKQNTNTASSSRQSPSCSSTDQYSKDDPPPPYTSPATDKRGRHLESSTASPRTNSDPTSADVERQEVRPRSHSPSPSPSDEEIPARDDTSSISSETPTLTELREIKDVLQVIQTQLHMYIKMPQIRHLKPLGPQTTKINKARRLQTKGPKTANMPKIIRPRPEPISERRKPQAKDIPSVKDNDKINNKNTTYKTSGSETKRADSKKLQQPPQTPRKTSSSEGGKSTTEEETGSSPRSEPSKPRNRNALRQSSPPSPTLSNTETLGVTDSSPGNSTASSRLYNSAPTERKKPQPITTPTPTPDRSRSRARTRSVITIPQRTVRSKSITDASPSRISSTILTPERKKLSTKASVGSPRAQSTTPTSERRKLSSKASIESLRAKSITPTPSPERRNAGTRASSEESLPRSRSITPTRTAERRKPRSRDDDVLRSLIALVKRTGW